MSGSTNINYGTGVADYDYDYTLPPVVNTQKIKAASPAQNRRIYRPLRQLSRTAADLTSGENSGQLHSGLTSRAQAGAMSGYYHTHVASQGKSHKGGGCKCNKDDDGGGGLDDTAFLTLLGLIAAATAFLFMAITMNRRRKKRSVEGTDFDEEEGILEASLLNFIYSGKQSCPVEVDQTHALYIFAILLA